MLIWISDFSTADNTDLSLKLLKNYFHFSMCVYIFIAVYIVIF